MTNQYLKHSIVTLATIGLGLGLTACGANAQETDSAEPSFDLIEPGVLTVASFGDAAPGLTWSENEEGEPDPNGTAGILMKDFAEEHNLTIKEYRTEFAGAILAVQQGRVDIMPGVFYSEERAEAMYYGAPDIELPLMVYLPKGEEYSEPTDLEGKKVAITEGQVWISKVQDELGDNLTVFPTNDTGAQALLNGQVDAYLQSLTGAANAPLKDNLDKVDYYPIEAGDFGLEEEDVLNYGHLGFSCQNTELAEAVNTHYEELQESGAWEDMLAEAGIDEQFWVENPQSPPQGCGD